MPETVLVPIDGSDPAEAALAFAIDRFPAAHLVVYHTIDPLAVVDDGGAEVFHPAFWGGEVESSRAEARSMLAAARRRAEREVESVEVALDLGPPVQNILQTVEAAEADQVVMGSHGRTGLGRVVVGSVAETVVRRATVPVTVVSGAG